MNDAYQQLVELLLQHGVHASREATKKIKLHKNDFIMAPFCTDLSKQRRLAPPASTSAAASWFPRAYGAPFWNTPEGSFQSGNIIRRAGYRQTSHEQRLRTNQLRYQ